jgi:surface glycoprotein (TIGR04207 family)
MSNRREKGRALFLTFIMVMSVVGMGVAFAGTAAADVTSLQNPTAENIDVGQESVTQTVTVEVTTDAGYENVTINPYASTAGLESQDFLSVDSASGSDNLSVQNYGINNAGVVYVNVTGNSTTTEVDGNLSVDISLNATGVATTSSGPTIDFADAGDSAAVSADFDFTAPDSITVTENNGNSIDYATDNVAEDGTVTVEAGTYNESVVIDGTNNLTLQGVEDANGNSPVTVGDGVSVGSQPHATIHVRGNGPTQGTTIEGFTIRNPDGHYGVYAGEGGSNSDVDGFVLRNNTIENIATNISSHSPLAGSVAGLYVRAQYDDLTVEDNTVRNVNTEGDQYQNAVGLSFSSFIGDVAFDSVNDTTSETAENTGVQNNVVTNITGAESSRTKGISASGEFDGMTIANNTLTDISANITDSTVLAISLSENPGGSGTDIDNDSTNERIGPRNFVIQSNDIDDITGQSGRLSTLFIGGYEDLGDNHVVEKNNFLDTDTAVARFAQNQSGFNPGDEDILIATSNWWGSTDGPGGDFNGNGASATGAISVDPANVTGIESGDVTLESDFLGIVQDDADSISVTETSSADINIDNALGTPANGTLVVDINDTEYVFEDALVNGELVNTSSSTNGPADIDESATTTGTADIDVVGNDSTTAVAQAGTVDLVHEAFSPSSSGYFLTSLPQPGYVYTQDISASTQYANGYDSAPALPKPGDTVNQQDIQGAWYLNADSADARYGFDFFGTDDERADVGTTTYQPGGYLLSSNYNISETSNNDIDAELGSAHESTLTAYPLDSSQPLQDSDTVDPYGGYFVVVNQDSTVNVFAGGYDATNRDSILVS